MGGSRKKKPQTSVSRVSLLVYKPGRLHLAYLYAKANRRDAVLAPATSSRYVELQVVLEAWDRLSP